MSACHGQVVDVQQLATHLETVSVVLTRMTQQVTVYKQQGKPQAAERLSDQISHLKVSLNLIKQNSFLFIILSNYEN